MRAFALFLVSAALALTACEGGASASTIKIGWFGPHSGVNASWGQAEFNTVQMVIDEYNAKGGIAISGKAYRLKAIGYDDEGDKALAPKMATRLAEEDKVTAIIGPYSSGEAIPVAAIMNKARIPLIATTATNPRVTVAEGGIVNEYMFRACFTDPYQGAVAATYAYKNLGKRRAAILMNPDDAYSAGLTEFFEKSFTEFGAAIVAKETFKAGDPDFKPQLRKMWATYPDVIFLPNYFTDVSLSAKQAREIGATAVMLGGDGWSSDNLIPLAGTALEGCFFVNHLDFNDPGVAGFRNDYKSKFGKEAEFTSYMARDALTMLIDAIQRAGSTDGKAIMEALETTDVQGVTGHIKIGPTHDPVGKDASIIKIVGTGMIFQEKIRAGQ